MSSNHNRDRVAAAFLAGKYARSGHMVAAGDKVYSYAHKLAEYFPGHPYDPYNFVLIDTSCDRCHSRTTATHAAALRRHLEADGWAIDSAVDDSELWVKPAV